MQAANNTDDFTAAESMTKSIALANVVGSISSSDPIPTNTSTKITTASQFGSVKTFIDEPEKNQIELILKWIVEPAMLSDILGGNQQIRNITVLLEGMRFNGYLRLFDINLSMIREY